MKKLFQIFKKLNQEKENYYRNRFSKDKILKDLANDLIYVPKTNHYMFCVLATIVLQLFAYYIAVGKKLNVDRPRNLAKSVTVE